MNNKHDKEGENILLAIVSTTTPIDGYAHHHFIFTGISSASSKHIILEGAHR
jgi:hypothetical protein